MHNYSDKTIHIVGAQETNYPWGFENKLISAFRKLGLKVLSTDFRKQKDNLSTLLNQPADILLVNKGEEIHPDLISSIPCITALWYAEQLGTLHHSDESSNQRRRELAYNIKAFDYVFSHDASNLNLYQSLGAKKTFWLPTALVDPEINYKLRINKLYDVVFAGSLTPRREKILNLLKKEGINVTIKNIWDPNELNKFFNESKIVLNIHLSDLPNTETRIAEVLGAGSFLLSENISSRGLLTEDKHYISFDLTNIRELAEKIRYYLDHNDQRERIAEEGHLFALANLSIKIKLVEFLDTIDFNYNQNIWPNYNLGVLRGIDNHPTLRMEEFYKSVKDNFKGSYNNLLLPETIDKSKPVNPYRILFINHNVYPLENSGTPISTFNHALQMKNIGADVAVLIPSMEIENGFSKQVTDNFILYKLPLINKYKVFLNEFAGNDLENYLKSAEMIAEDFKPNIIQINDYVFMPIEIISMFHDKGITVIRNVCNLEELCLFDSPVISHGTKGELCSGPENSKKCAECLFTNKLGLIKDDIIKEEFTVISGKIQERFDKIQLLYSNYVDGIIFTGSPFMEYFTRYINLSSQLTTIIPRGFKFDSIRTTEPRIKSKGKVKFGFIGHLNFTKGIDVLLNAFEIIADQDNFTVSIYGASIEACYDEWIKKLADTYPSKFIYHGSFDPSQLKEIVQSLDIVIVPSYFDTYNRVVRELLYYGIPLIVTDFFGSSIIIDNVNGIKIKIGDINALAAVMKRILLNPQKITELSRGAVDSKIPSVEEEINEISSFYKKSQLQRIDRGIEKNGKINSLIKLIAFYLPQYHTIPENDKWWGNGFTEWKNVKKAVPLFKEHYQPHVPSDLGYYDLKSEETRIAQADMARYYGISGFCYYHYWFNGKLLLEHPIHEMVRSGKPDFPFCLCWANEDWTRTWDGKSNEVLIKQTYNNNDDTEHINYLIPIFKDKRYITIDGKPIILIYKASNLPDPNKTFKMWREECQKAGIKDIFICNIESSDEEHFLPELKGFDASVEFQPDWQNIRDLLNGYSGQWVCKYEDFVKKMLNKQIPSYKRFPCVVPSWDNSARRNKDAVIIAGSNPSLYKDWLREVIIRNRNKSDNIVFINAWNEWGEGCHLEPDTKFGRGYLNATKDAIEESVGLISGRSLENIEISIIIPTLNNLEYSKNCIESIRKNSPTGKYEIIIVDNCSLDGSIEYFKSLEKEKIIKLILNCNPENYSHSNNQGADIAEGRYLLFLNNDIQIFSGWFNALIESFEEDPKVGIQGGMLLYPNNTIQHAGIVYAAINPQLMLHSHIYLNEKQDAIHVNKKREFQMVTGAMLAIRKGLYNELKGFDEGYIFGHEDLDLCMAVRQANYKVIYNPAVKAYHFESMTKKLNGLERYALNINDPLSIDYKNYKRFHGKWDKYLITDAEKYFEADGFRSHKKEENKIQRIMFTMYGWNESGGGTIFPKEVTKELVKRGYSVSVFYASLKNDPLLPSYSIEKTVEDGVKLYGIFNRPAIFIDPDNPEREINDDRVVKIFKEILNEEKPDIVHFNNFHGLTFAMAEVAKKFGIHSCYTPHNYHMIDPNLYLFNNDLSLWDGVDIVKNSEAVKSNKSKKNHYIKRAHTARKLMNNWVDLTLAVSTRQRDLLIKFGANDKRITVVHQSNKSTDEVWINKELRKENERLIKSPIRIGFIGGVMPQKGVHFLAAAAQYFNKDEAEFHIYGFVFPAYLEQLKKIDVKHNLHFHGEYKQEQLAEIAHNIDIAVVPSIWEDCAPLVLLELNAMRLPIIAAKIGGIPDFIEEGVNGFLYEHNSIEQLKDKIGYCVKNVDIIFEMRKSLVQRHSFKKYVDHIEMIYNKLVNATWNVNDLELKVGRKEDPLIDIVWEGSQFVNHSLAYINRELCNLLIDHKFNLSIIPFEQDKFQPSPDNPHRKLKYYYNKKLKNTDIHIRHHWPPNLTAPENGHWVVIQPWEFGSLPKQWVEIFSSSVDEMWVPSNYVRNVYIDSGLPAERIFVIPNGFDPNKINPMVKPFKIKTQKKFKFLFVGGTIYRKGIDIILEAYQQTFKKKDNVCLVIKDMGGNSFYKGQNFRDKIAEMKKQVDSPEIVYIDQTLSEKELAGLYTACNALVHPYRGEGFGLPILEAMASGTPAIVTNGGSCLDFCNQENSLLIDAEKFYLKEKKIDDMDTVDYPWLFEPSLTDLKKKLLFASQNPDYLEKMGKSAYDFVSKRFTWENSFFKMADRIKIINELPIIRFNNGEGNLQEILKLISIRLENKEFDNAIRLINQAEFIIDNDGRGENVLMHSELLCLKGFSYLGIDDNISARECFEKGLKVNPSSSSACIGLADIFLNNGEIESAKMMYEWGLKNSPGNKIASDRLREINKIPGLNEVASPLLKQADKVSFNDLFLEAFNLFKETNYHLALDRINTAADLYSTKETAITPGEFNLLKGNIYLSNNDLEGAKTAFELVLNDNSRSSEASLGLGTIFFRSDMLNESKIMLEWAVKYDNKNLLAIDSLSEVNRLLGFCDAHNSLYEISEFPELQEIQSGNSR